MAPTKLQVAFAEATGFKPLSADQGIAGRWVPQWIGPGAPGTGQKTWVPDGRGGWLIQIFGGTSLGSPFTVAKLAIFAVVFGITDMDSFLFECAKRRKGFLRPTGKLGPYNTDPSAFADVPGGLGYPMWELMAEVAVELGFKFQLPA